MPSRNSSVRTRNGTLSARTLRAHAPVFAALGDETRLSLVAKLASGQSLSLSALADGTRVTRQAVTKHLRVLEGAGLVKGERRGRESLYQLTQAPLDDARAALEAVSAQWDAALGRLKAFVERSRQ